MTRHWVQCDEKTEMLWMQFWFLPEPARLAELSQYQINIAKSWLGAVEAQLM